MSIEKKLQELFDDLFIHDKEFEMVEIEERFADLILEVGELEYRMSELEH